MSTAVETAQPSFAAIVGAARVVADPAHAAALSVDGQAPQCVVFPTTAEQVAAVLRCAAEHGLAVIACRNATKLGVGNVPRRYDVAVSLKELQRVGHYEPADLTVTAEAGMEFGDFQQFVGRDGLWLPLDPPGGARASLGGILATNASGPLRLSYGAPRDMVIGMKIATTEGKLIKTGARVVKSVAGYDMAKLLLGSYGTLGVIVEASFRLYPLPHERMTFVLPAGTLGIARDLRQRILQSPIQPMRAVLLDALAAKLTLAGTSLQGKGEEPQLLVEVGGSVRVLERCTREIEELGQAAGAPVDRLGTEEASSAWLSISDFRTWLLRTCPGAVLVRAALPDSATEELLSRAQQEAENERIPLAGFCQLGVGIVNLALLETSTAAALVALLRRLRKAAQGLGGVLVVEHCHWDIKSRVDVWGSTGDDFAVMAKVKAAWDPKGTLAPGRFVGGI